GGIALDDEDLGALARGIGAVGELAREPQLAYRVLAQILLLLAAADALLRAVDDEVEKLVRLGGIAGEPVVEWIAHRVLDDARGLRRRQPILGLALEFGLTDEYRDHASRAIHGVIARDRRRALALAHPLGVVLDALQQRAAQAGLVRAAVRRRNRVAVGGQEPVAIGGPPDGPLRSPVYPDFARAAGEDVGMDQRGAV